MATSNRKRASGKPSGKRPRPSPAARSKIDTLVELLQGSKGVNLPAMMKATGWQAHSVRGALSGALKKARGLTITSEKVDGVRVYRIAP